LISFRLYGNALIRLIVALVVVSFLAVPPAYCQDNEDSQVFIGGFNAYQQKDYALAIDKMNEVLQKYPDTPLRDMALFWLSRSYFKAGNQQDAARYFSQFSKEYPDNPLKGTVEEELLSLAARYDRGEKLAAGSTPVRQPDRVVAQKVEKETPARAEESARMAAAESARLAALRNEEQRRSALKAERERLEERIAAQKLAAEKEEREAAAKSVAVASESARLAALRNEEQRRSALRAEQERMEKERIAAEKLAAERAEYQRLAAEKAEQQRIAAAKAYEERRLSAEKAEKELRALAKAEEAKWALQAEQELKIAEKAAFDAENSRQAATRAEEQRLPRQSVTDEKVRAQKALLRDKAIAQYKLIIDRYPSTAAAATAAAKLREFGLAVALPSKVAAVETQETTQVLSLEVTQFAGVEFNLQARPTAYKVAQRISMPFEITNRGNGNDSFSLESGFPAAFNTSFAAVSSTETAINQSPALAPGETFRGVLNLVIPASSIDGLRITYPVKATSRFTPESGQSREVSLIASAPLLRAVLKTDKTKPLPGEKVVYRVALLNVGSTAAQDVTFRISFPSQLEPVDYEAAGFRQEMKSALVLNSLHVNSGESREFSVTFQLKEDSPAGQELSTRAELFNNQLKTTVAFVSNIAYVQPQRGILVRSGSGRIIVIPGQTVAVPFVVSNTGNVREKFKITSTLKGAQDAVIFHDMNRDGIRQAGEPVITEIGPLAPKEEASVVMEIKTPASAVDGSEGSVMLSFSSEGEPGRSASGSAQLVYSRPVLQMIMARRDGGQKPGEVASFDLTITNKGSNLARVVELQSSWPEQLELVASDPANISFSNGIIIWRFKELGAGEKRIIKVFFRVKPGTGVGTSIQVKNVMTYEDQLGNRY
jgi:uncharacterized repeat protein (TIGR01451 family)